MMRTLRLETKSVTPHRSTTPLTVFHKNLALLMSTSTAAMITIIKSSMLSLILRNSVLETQQSEKYYTFFISNQIQASALKVAYSFKVFGAQSYLMNAQQFEQLTNICKEYSKFHDSVSKFMINEFKIFPIMLLRQLNLDALSIQQLFCDYYKGKTPLFFNLQLLWLINEKRLGPKFFINSCKIAYKPVAYKRNKSIPKNDFLGDGFDSSFSWYTSKFKIY